MAYRLGVLIWSVFTWQRPSILLECCMLKGHNFTQPAKKGLPALITFSKQPMVALQALIFKWKQPIIGLHLTITGLRQVVTIAVGQ